MKTVWGFGISSFSRAYGIDLLLQTLLGLKVVTEWERKTDESGNL